MIAPPVAAAGADGGSFEPGFGMGMNAVGGMAASPHLSLPLMAMYQPAADEAVLVVPEEGGGAGAEGKSLVQSVSIWHNMLQLAQQ
jgi:hypothetical protein